MIKNVTIKPGCISCRTCEGICPKVFQVQGTSQVVTDDYADHEEAILRAESSCPVQVIAVELDNSGPKKPTAPTATAASLVKKIPLTKDVFEFHFHIPQFTFQPGQFVTVQMKDEAGSFVRCYSVKGYGSETLKLCIKVVERGRGGQFLQQLIPGQSSVPISQGAGNFLLQPTNNPKFFVATGTGVAPMMAMLQHDTESPKRLLLGFRDESDIFYAEDIQHFKNTESFITLSRPNDQWTGFKGRVTDILETWEIDQKTEIYICGNPMMVESTIEYLKQKRQFPEMQIYCEHFTSPPETAPAKTETSTPLVKSLSKPSLLWGSEALAIIQRLLLIASFCLPLAYFFPVAQGPLWDYSLYAVTLLMLIRPLGDIFPKISFFRRLIPLRKELGIFSASIVVTYGAFHYLDPTFDFWGMYFSAAYWTPQNGLLAAHLGELTGFILLLTSNTWSQILLGRWWKRIQRLAYVYFFSGAFYVWTAFDKSFALWGMVTVAIFWTWAFMIRKWKKS